MREKVGLFCLWNSLDDRCGDLGFPLCVDDDVSDNDVSGVPTPSSSSDVQSDSVLSCFLIVWRWERKEKDAPCCRDLWRKISITVYWLLFLTLSLYCASTKVSRRLFPYSPPMHPSRMCLYEINVILPTSEIRLSYRMLERWMTIHYRKCGIHEGTLMMTSLKLRIGSTKVREIRYSLPYWENARWVCSDRNYYS